MTAPTPTAQLETRIAAEIAAIAAAEARLREARDELGAAVGQHVMGSDTTRLQDKLLAEIHELNATLPEKRAALEELTEVRKAASRATRKAAYEAAARDHAAIRGKMIAELEAVAVHFAAIAPAAKRLRDLGEDDWHARQRAESAMAPGDLDVPVPGYFRDVAHVTGNAHEAHLHDVLQALDELAADAANRPPTHSLELQESYADWERRNREAVAEFEADLHNEAWQKKLRDHGLSNMISRAAAEAAFRRRPDEPAPQPRAVPYRVAR